MAGKGLIGLSELASYGFSNLEQAQTGLEEFLGKQALDSKTLLSALAQSQNPDSALAFLNRIQVTHRDQLQPLLRDLASLSQLCLILGASSALGEFLLRNPEELVIFTEKPKLPTPSEMVLKFEENVENVQGLRVTYRSLLLQIACFDLSSVNPISQIGAVSAALADLAGAVIDAGLRIAKSELISGENGRPSSAELVRATKLAVIGMGKCGARELNYVSDVDVIYVCDQSESEFSTEEVLEVATRLASRMMRLMDEPGAEPALWQVDANLRPEGKSGALVRTLDSHFSYYERWAQNWEFQALLKARPIAGDLELGERYISKILPMVWESAAKANFVESVQRMRERVTENIPANEAPYQIKLGPGGLRDVEFTVQLLQLVHGRSDKSLRVADTLGALSALSKGGYISRADAEKFSAHYSFLRLLEHRIQLQLLRRSHLMPKESSAQRSIARAVQRNLTAEQLIAQWELVKLEVRSLHQILFYRPLLTAVSGLSSEDLELSSDQAKDRLAAIGFQDPKGALGHITALTSGLSRRAAIQRALLPVLLQWFSEGTEPDAALLAFRRLSEDLGESHWYLRMLRDSAGAAQRMTQVLSSSKLATALFERIPEAAAWFENLSELLPRSRKELSSEFEAIISRHEVTEEAAASIRAIRRRELLRIAIANVLGEINLDQISQGITDLTEAYLLAMLAVAKEDLGEEPVQELAIVAMGRFGGAEMGFGSDADVIFVYRVLGPERELAQSQAERIVSNLRSLSKDPVFEFELDLDLRPEGKNGPVVRSIESYSAYYQRWADSWESQALLRARVITQGGVSEEFIGLIDNYRYPIQFPDSAITEIRRIKARVEVERLPQGADPKRHLKLGRGSISDVEWLVQLFQLKFAKSYPNIKGSKTLQAISEMEKSGLLKASDAKALTEAWSLASRIRSAAVLYSNKRSDVLPVDRRQLEGIARLLGYPRGAASDLEEDYLASTRRSRIVFERLFFS